MAEGAEDVPVIYLHEIKRQYVQGEQALVILDGAKLALWAGQSVALVAPSGSGKSTLLHIAGLLESPDDGEVYVAGAPTSQLSDMERTQIRRNDIGFVYQSHRLLPGILRARERHAAADDPGPQTFGDDQALERNPGLSRPRRPHQASTCRAFGRRAAACRHCAGRGQCPARAARRRADRQSRSEHRRPRLPGTDAAREGDQRRHADRHPQHGA